MVKVVEALSHGQEALVTGYAFDPEEGVGLGDRDDSPGYTAGDAFRAAMVRENFALDAMRHLKYTTDDDGNVKGDWNQFSYMKENWDPERLKNFEQEISDGHFDDVASPEALELRAQEIHQEREALNAMQSHFGSALAGGLLTALVDPTTYVPIVGVAGRTTKLAKLFTFLSQTTALTAVSELSLQNTQNLRQIEESFMNIGFSAALGGGIGYLHVARNARHPLHPDNPDNPLRVDAEDDMAIRDMDGSEDVIPAGDAPNDVSAARAPRTEGVDKLGGQDGIIGRFFNGATLVGRAFNASSATYRSVAGQLMELGGVFTKQNAKGLASGPSVEAIKDFHRVRGQEVVVFGDVKLREAIQEMGFKGIRKTPVAVQFNELAFRELHDAVDDNFIKSLTDEFGEEGVSVLRTKAKEYVEEIHSANEHFENLLIKHQLLRDNDLLSELEFERQALRDKRDADLLAQQPVKGEDGKAPKKTAEQKQKAQEIKTASRAKLKDLDERIQAEKAKPEALGRDYGVMQSWDPDAIIQNKEDFENLLYDILIDKDKIDEDWLVSEFPDVPSVAALDDLRTSNPEKYDEVLHAWAGDEYYVEITKAENAVKGAEFRAKQATLDLNDILRDAGLLRRREKNLTLAQARKKRDAVHGERAASEALMAELQAERRAIIEAAQAARTETLVRQQQFNPVKPDAGAKELDALKKADEAAAEAELNLEFGAQGAAKADDLVPEITKFGAANERVRKAEQKATVDPVEPQGAPKTEVTPELAAQRARATEIAKQLSKETRRFDQLAARAAKYDEALQAAQGRLEAHKVAKKELQDLQKTAKAHHKLEVSDLNKVKKALLRRQKAPGIDQVARQIALNLSQGKHMPAMGKIFDEVVAKTGRVKERQLRLNREQYLRAVQPNANGVSFLRTDLPNLLERQYDELSAHLAMTEVFGLRKGGRFEAWGDSASNTRATVVGSVKRDYEDLMKGASPKEVARLQKEMEQRLKDLEMAKARILGQVDNGDPDSWATWVGRKFRQANHIRFGSGFGLTSLTDIAAVGLRHNILPMLKEHFSESWASLRNVSEGELQSMIYASEFASSNLALAKRVGDVDAFSTDTFGIGPAGSNTQKATGLVDKAFMKASNVSSTLSLLPLWNRFWKTMVGVQMSYKLRDQVLNYASLSDMDKTVLASLGIGKTEATSLARNLEKFSSIGDDGRIDIDFSKWDPTSTRLFKMAIQRDMNRAIVTPGVGDTPRLMSNELGKFMLQFYTFGFATMNRVITPMLQRGANGQSLRAMKTVTLMLSAASVVASGKAVLRGENPADMWEEDNLNDTMLDILDRSSLLAHLSAPTAALAKAAGIAEGSRYSRESAGWNLAGVNVSLGKQLADLASSTVGMADGEFSSEDILRKADKVRPFASFTSLLERAFGALSGEPDFKVINKLTQ